jgi:TatD DNase family protein
VVREAGAAGVTRMIAMGVDLERSKSAVAMATRYEEVWAAIGHHPLEWGEPDLDALRELAADPNAVAIGEIGLDFEHPGGPDRDHQLSVLDAMFSLATELDLPVSIHNRGAERELLDAISEYPRLRGVMHYFTLEGESAQRFLDAGFYISFAGVITRPSRQTLREVVKQCPADRLLMETDSPYGNAQKRMGVPNRPAFLIDTAEVVAQLRGVAMDALAEQERANAYALFKKMK